MLQFIAGRRLAQPRFTVVDATNVQRESRRPLVELARASRPVRRSRSCSTCPRRSAWSATARGPTASSARHVVHRQRSQLRRSLKGLQREGFRRVWVLRSPEEVDGASSSRRVPLWTDRRAERGPFDVIGDVHGCYAELVALLRELGYERRTPTATSRRRRTGAARYSSATTSTAGPTRRASCSSSWRWPRRARRSACRATTTSSSCASSRAATSRSRTASPRRSPSWTASRRVHASRSRDFLDGLVSHVVLDDGRLVVAHAGMKEAYQGRASGRVRDFALFGDTTGETDEFGLPVRLPWARDYRGARGGRLRPHAGRGGRSGSTTRSTSTPAASSAAG